MNTVTVSASKNYNVYIDAGLLTDLGSYASSVIKPCSAVIISDSNVWPLYGNVARSSLEKAGYQVAQYVFHAGEASKNGATYLDVLNFLARQQITRSDLLIALGGGVVGDLTGFVAATYLRGIAFIQVPTSLLAMVDSSVGGKTAIDLEAGKNLAGAFYQPSLVLCDLDTLATLPETIFRDGCAEVIKYAILYDPMLFHHLRENGINFDRSYVISRCVSLKRDVVADDEFDKGSRQMLNLGHTIGHGIESCSKYTVSHGYAVAAGIAIISRYAASQSICDQAHCLQIINTLESFGLPTKTLYNAQDLYQRTLSDKKRSGGRVNLIVPVRIGQCHIHSVPIDALINAIEAGL